MAVREVDENQLAALQSMQGFVTKALNDPKHRVTLLKIQKELYPDVAVPEIDAANPVLEKLTALEQKFEDDRKAREERDAKVAEDSQKAQWERQWLSGRKKLTDSGVNPEGIEAVEKLMTERNIPDHEAAWALFEKLNPAPPPQLTGSSRFNWFQQAENAPDIKLITDHQDYDSFLGQAIDMARRDFRANQGG